MFIRGSALLVLVGVALGVGTPGRAETAAVLGVNPHLPQQAFSVDNRLQKNVDFWIRIYSEITTSQGVIHDAKYVDRVYEVIEVGAGRSSSRIKEAKKKWMNVLLSLHLKQRANRLDSLTEDEARVFQLYQDINDPDKFLSAAHRKRMRFQLGQKDRFLAGLRDSGKYLPLMEEIFRREGLPLELTRLPFVESSFNLKARSKVGASGIWQFMRSTGKLFLKINDAVDERNDPIRATEAAAKLLKLNFESLNNWPLAVTAYNHGRMGMMRAVRLVGSESLEEVVGQYRSRSFGFASSNFFTELLAAVEVERNHEKYFGKVIRAEPVKFFEVRVPDYIDFRELARFMKLDITLLRELNPGLANAVYSGHRLIPAGYFLRLPHKSELEKEAEARIFLAGYAQIPAYYKHRGQRTVAGKRGSRGSSGG